MLLAALERDGAVRISDLTRELGVTSVTLRRDLAQLEREGLLVRVHGGAVRAAPSGTSAADAATTAAVDVGTIAVLVPSLDYYWPGVVRGIESAARRHGYRTLLRGASYELQDERPVLQRLLRGEDIKGLIIAPNTDTPHAQDVIQRLAGLDIPSVLVERDAVAMPSHEPVESVASDHALGGALAARHLAGLGHRRIGLVLSRTSPTSRKISGGWRAACAELGVETRDFEVLLPDRRSTDFSDVVNATLDRTLREGLTGLLVHSDPEAMAFLDLALERGIRVPDELSIIAYDDEVAQLYSPALTAVSPPRGAVGESAMDLIVRRLADPGLPVARVLLSPTLNVRESTSVPPSDERHRGR
jgi:DNA-binding LacI/PurR family transcriptional regulator